MPTGCQYCCPVATLGNAQLCGSCMLCKTSVSLRMHRTHVDLLGDRVHAKHMGHPILGDEVYGGSGKAVAQKVAGRSNIR